MLSKKTMNRKQLMEVVRFGIVGTTAMVIHYGIYFVLLPLMDKNIAYSIGYFISFLCNFLMSSYFTFRVKPSWTRLFRFSGSHLINYFVYLGLFNLFCWLGIPPKWAPLPVYAIAVPISFLLVRFALKKKSTAATILLVLLCNTTAFGQQKVVVADAVSHESVERASLYTKEGGTFHAAISNEQGVANVDFSFRRLTISHLNYEQRVVSRLGDTLFLQPKYRQTAEVVVTNKEPEWIRRKLRQAAKLKEQNYQMRADTMASSYHTESIDKHSLYRYHLTGLLRMRDAQHKLYAMQPDVSRIESSDSTTLTDVTNLRRMLSEDFMNELTRGFIGNHRWGVNYDYEGRTKDVVELVFRSKHGVDDRGRLVIDTARCVVLSAYRFTGTETNRRERMPMALYAMARVLSGYKVEKWTRYYRVQYGERTDGTLYPKEVSYKTYMETHDAETDQEQADYEQQIGGGFPNMEATLTISETAGNHSIEAMEELPASWYLRYSTEESRQQEVRLANLPAQFELIPNS